MSSKKPIIAMIVVLAVCFTFATSFLTSDQEELDTLYSQYTKSTQDFRKISVKTVKKIIEKDGDGNGGSDSDEWQNSQMSTESWLAICKKVHNSWGGQGFTYRQSTRTWTDLNNNENVTVRTDCSGYVSACLYSAGLTNNPIVHTSQDDWSKDVSNVVEVSVADLKAGDIKVSDGHVEIYAGEENGQHKVFNWGSASSAQNKYAGTSNPNEVDARSNKSTISDTLKVYRVTLANAYSGSKLSGNKMILLDAGHGYKDAPDNQRRSTGEESWTWCAAKVLKKSLESAGFTVKLISNDERWSLSNPQRGAIYASSQCDLMIQVHANATGSVTGGEDYRALYQSGGMTNRKISDGIRTIVPSQTARGHLIVPAHAQRTIANTLPLEAEIVTALDTELKKTNSIIPYKGIYEEDYWLGVGKGAPNKPIILWEAGFGTTQQDRDIMYNEAKFTELCNDFVSALTNAYNSVSGGN